jgi:DNA-binding beta-propeller fold protein YncE
MSYLWKKAQGSRPGPRNRQAKHTGPISRGVLATFLAIGAWVLIPGTTPAFSFNYIDLSQFGASGSGAGQFSEPQGLAVDQATNDLYVADAGNHRIEKFDESGHFIVAWGWGVADGKAQSEVCTEACQAGLQGVEPGQLSRPMAIAVDNSADASKGDVYVADEANDAVDKFEPDGRYLLSITGGSGGPFGAVHGVTVDAEGNVWIDDSAGNVYEFSEGGSESKQWNTNDGANPGLAVDASRDIYTVSNCHCSEEFSDAGQYLGELDPENENATGLAIDLATNRIFDDQKTFVAKYAATASPPATLLTTFGQGILQDGTGVAVDSSGDVVYVADAATDQIDVFAPQAPGPPQIESSSVADVAATSAELKATIYTGQSSTSYRFEYGATELYEHDAPATSTEVGAGLEDVSLSAAIIGLSPNTLYYYRVVAENAHGIMASGVGTFLTFGSEASTGLPDGRAYELVSPSDKNDGDIGFLGKIDAQVASNGGAVTYGSLTSFGTSQSAELISQYLSTRGPSGWATQGISPSASFDPSLVLSPPYEGFNTDLSAGVLAWNEPGLTVGAPLGYRNLYVRNNSNDSYQLVTTVAPNNGSESRFVAASADYSHIVFETGDALVAGAVANAENVYEWTAGNLSLASIPSGGTIGAPGSSGGGGPGDAQGAVSSDGSRIFWTDDAGQLYVREDGARTIKVNLSQRTPSIGDGEALFLGATSDGSHVLFSDGTSLTDSPDDNGGLYEFDTETGDLTDLTPDSAGNPELKGVLGYDNDGSSVYFVASGDLASGASQGQPNLYIASNGTLSFIATLSGDDSGDWAVDPASRHASVSPDGVYAVFMSDASLTGYDNTDENTGKLDSEVFEYDAATRRLHCVSCNPSRERPTGPSSVPDWLNANYNPHYLSEDGNRVFFDSADGLTLRDTNGGEGVYEWETGGPCAQSEGCVYLISSGIGNGESLFADASLNGDDVFFVTATSLVRGDTDEEVDLYDARVDGGFPEVPSPEQCSGEACAGPLSAAPTFESPPTALLSDSTEEDGSRLPATFTAGPVHSLVSGVLAREGKLELRVHVSEAGRIVASVTARVRGHVKRVGVGSMRATRAGTFVLVLTLTKAARSQLATHHRLRVTVTVSFSGSSSTKRFAVRFDDMGHGDE